MPAAEGTYLIVNKTLVEWAALLVVGASHTGLIAGWTSAGGVRLRRPASYPRTPYLPLRANAADRQPWRCDTPSAPAGRLRCCTVPVLPLDRRTQSVTPVVRRDHRRYCAAVRPTARRCTADDALVVVWSSGHRRGARSRAGRHAGRRHWRRRDSTGLPTRARRSGGGDPHAPLSFTGVPRAPCGSHPTVREHSACAWISRWEADGPTVVRQSASTRQRPASGSNESLRRPDSHQRRRRRLPRARR